MTETVFDLETTGRTPWTAELLRAGIGTESFRMPVARREMRRLLSRPGVIIEHTLFDVRWALLDGARLGPETEVHDLRQMAWLLDPDSVGRLRLEDLAPRYLGREVVKPIVTRAGQPVWSTDLWPIDGEDRRHVPLDEVPDEVMDEYSGGDLDVEADLYDVLRSGLERAGLWDLFLEVEVPMARSIAEMEAAGLPFDLDRCEQLRAAVQLEADELEVNLVEAAGIPVLLSSTDQLSRLLFAKRGERVELKDSLLIDDEDLALIKDVPRDERVDWFNQSPTLPEGFEVLRVGRTYVHGVWVGEGMGLKTAEHGFGSSKHWKEAQAKHKRPSTSSVSLVLSNPEDKWVADLVYWRELDKLAGAFLSKFPQYVHEGRLHGTVNRCGTVTGRFSSAEPNLQNIPAHGTYGALVRSLFAGDLVLGDYAQLEQRIATHYCRDPVMVKAYAEDVDLYGLAASILFGGEASKKHPQRGLLKTGMLGIQYGAGAGKLAQLVLIDDTAVLEFNVTGSQVRSMAPGTVTEEMREAAKGLIDQLREVFPVFFAWRDEVVLRAARAGEVVTLSGRRRRLVFPAGWDRYVAARQAAAEGDSRAKKQARILGNKYSEEGRMRGFSLERQAINTLCQGGAADVVGGAMTAVRLGMPDEVKTLVQVHDEMVWERLGDWHDDSLARLRELCETGHGYDLTVPLQFEAMLAETWADKGAAGQNTHGLFVDRMKRGREAVVDSHAEGLQSRKASQLARKRQRA